MTTPLELKDLCVDRAGKRVLEAVSFSVDTGETYALLGGNGAGKSTTLLATLGLLPSASGRLLVNGQQIEQDPEGIRRNIAYLPEAVSLYPQLSARENLEYFLALADVEPSVQAIDSALDQVALAAEARDQRLESYSKGMRQKVAIALALLRGTEILLLDEPTSGLDPVAIDELHTLVRKLATEGKTILMVTHDVYGACQVANRIGLLQRGRLVGEFTAEDGERIATEAVHRAFAEGG
ncbi:MAG: ABC transporter ATP-binding protein [Pseudomonadota bacterium]